ncbi:hypothetical protein B0H17DRAFT_714011 [Mycena rosella]|uniref:BTB domain-containing protein n=1 Tax=Mycena rosella TaxID=1033263 RepID=A0AAD7GG64_MYCRO|nr:hypothetical protein B0H17DRAFT_714011 [Mycena rosella]
MSSSECPPAKRPRTEDTPPISRSKTIWYKDGSVVLQAQNTQFRVHWGVLSLHSSFFRDMQDVPQPPEQESVEGCPLIEVSDTVSDLENLLNALYNPLFNKESLPFNMVASIVRLGRKYDFKELLDTAIDRLTRLYPSTLAEFHSPPKSPSLITLEKGLQFEVINLATENGIFSILPCAYYRVIEQYSTNQAPIFNGIARTDGTITLSAADQTVCILAHAKMLVAQFQPGNTLGWCPILNPATIDEQGCTDPATCRRMKDRLFRAVAVPPKLWALASGFTVDKWKFCPGCTQSTKDQITTGQMNMWESLPSFFDLPPWADLKNNV